ncbi:MAG: helix-turn-helix domain-containing protein [Desulfosporosinus sp.]
MNKAYRYRLYPSAEQAILISELVQLKLNIESSVTKASSGGFRRSRTSQEAPTS